MKKILSCLILFACGTSTFACLNFYVVNESGKHSIYDNYPPYRIFMHPSSDLESLHRAETYIAQNAGPSQYKYISNYCAYLIKLGRHKEALPILKKWAAEKPLEYEILSNLATAYELNNYPDSALRYLKLSLQINPRSHSDSEWFHVRILNAKISIRDKQTKIEELNLLGIESAKTIHTGYQLSRQLRERIPLTSSPNALLSKSIEESADYYKRVVSVEWSIKLYAMAIGFAGSETDTTRIWKKINAARKRLSEIKEAGGKTDKREDIRKHVLSKNWKSYLNKDISKWKADTAHYEEKLTILDL